MLLTKLARGWEDKSQPGKNGHQRNIFGLEGILIKKKIFVREKMCFIESSISSKYSHQHRLPEDKVFRILMQKEWQIDTFGLVQETKRFSLKVNIYKKCADIALLTRICVFPRVSTAIVVVRSIVTITRATLTTHTAIGTS